jgi:hypothetical protein
MPRRTDYVKAAASLIRAIGERHCALAGGLAVWAHGYVRGTRDVDVICGISLDDAKRLLAAQGIRAGLHRGDVFEGGFSCLKGETAGVPFDILPQLVSVAWESTISLDVAGRRLRVVPLETLVELKLKAGGPKDLMDVAMLVLLHPEHAERARQLSVAYRVKDALARCLEDPRVEAEARAIAEQERRAARRGSPRRRPRKPARAR